MTEVMLPGHYGFRTELPNMQQGSDPDISPLDMLAIEHCIEGQVLALFLIFFTLQNLGRKRGNHILCCPVRLSGIFLHLIY